MRAATVSAWSNNKKTNLQSPGRRRHNRPEMRAATVSAWSNNKKLTKSWTEASQPPRMRAATVSAWPPAAAWCRAVWPSESSTKGAPSSNSFSTTCKIKSFVLQISLFSYVYFIFHSFHHPPLHDRLLLTSLNFTFKLGKAHYWDELQFLYKIKVSLRCSFSIYNI